MKGAGSQWAFVAADRRSIARSLARVIDHSLVLYLLFVVAGRAWVLLNTDLTQLIRRVH
jgi:hypothetical protein